jgi:hypothetical protein
VTSKNRPTKRKSIGKRPTRSITQLRTELRTALAVAPGSIDPTSAESIRKALHCSPAKARQLRDQYRAATRHRQPTRR